MMAISNDTKMLSQKYLRPERLTFAESYPYGITKKIDKFVESVLLMIWAIDHIKNLIPWRRGDGSKATESHRSRSKFLSKISTLFKTQPTISFTSLAFVVSWKFDVCERRTFNRLKTTCYRKFSAWLLVEIVDYESTSSLNLDTPLSAQNQLSLRIWH